MKRSSTRYPMEALDLCGFLKKAWSEGCFDEYSEDHFLIKALNGRLEEYKGYRQFIANNLSMYNIKKDNFQINFCINLSSRLDVLSRFFGEEKIVAFLKNQMSAGKANYDEYQFFRALSEVSILSFWRMRANSGEYEPKTNTDKNPEARFYCNNGVIVDVEVKTPGFPITEQFIQEYAIPTVLLDDKGKDFVDYCESHQLVPILPRVNKLKDFLNSAAEKFVSVDHVKHMNLLYINWTFSEFPEVSFLEAYSLLNNPCNGLLVNRKVGKEIGINDEVYDKITAVIVYTESLNGLMFDDFRYVWTKTANGEPHFAVVGLKNKEELFAICGMSDSCERIDPTALLLITKNEEYRSSLKDIIRQHVKR